MDLFHHARTVTLEDLETALSPTDFWYSFILPLGHTSEAVKHAICALGGAHRLFKVRTSKVHPSSREILDISVQQYNQAIRCVRVVMDAATEQDLHIILTCCLIFISIESLHGRYAESLRHLKAGTSLLVSLKSKIDPQHDTSEFGTGATRGSRFLDSLAEAFCRLGNDVWGYVREVVIPDLNFDVTTNAKSLDHTISFNSVSQAEEHFHHVTKLFEADKTFISREMMSWIMDQRLLDTSQQIPPMPSQVPAHHHLIPFEDLEVIFNSWSDAFDCFRSRLDESTTTSQEILRTRALAVDQALWSGWLKCKTWSDYQQQDYEEILRRAESLVQLDAFQSSPVFTFDGSLILSLAIPCVSSMDRDIQWRSIRLLRSFWRREGIWDSQELADILEAMMMATSLGLVTKDMLPWDVPHLARLLHALELDDITIPEGPLLLD